MTDSLSLLRNNILNKQEIVIEGNDFVFGRFKFPKTSLTNFKSSVGPYLTLHAVYLCHLHKDLSRGLYILACSKAGSTPVALVDKKELLAYLYGETDSSTQIESAGTGSNLMSIDSQAESSLQRGGDDYDSSQQTGTQQNLSMTTTGSGGAQMMDEFKEILPSNFTGSNGIVNKIDLYELDLTSEQIKEKEIICKQIEIPKIKPINMEGMETEDNFIDSIKQKRSAGDMEKTQFLLSDEKLTKLMLQRERQINDRVSILQASAPEAFIGILNSFKKFKSDEEDKKRKPHHHSSSSSNGSGISNGIQSNGNSGTSSPNPKNRTPIVIVPNTLTSLLTLFNIKEFLQQSKFVPTIEKKSEMSAQNIPKPSIVTIDRIRNEKKIVYEVIDNVKLIKPEDWPRVAAVFVQGEAWQFKDYKWNTPVDLLSHVKGYYLRFDDSTLPDVVKSWDVRQLTISKSKRHLDQTAQIEFWNSLDEYILARKPFLNH